MGLDSAPPTPPQQGGGAEGLTMMTVSVLDDCINPLTISCKLQFISSTEQHSALTKSCGACFAIPNHPAQQCGLGRGS